MLTNKSLVLAIVAIADKIDNLKRKKIECEKWMEEGEQNEENHKFWAQHIEKIEKDIQAYISAKAELIHTPAMDSH